MADIIPSSDAPAVLDQAGLAAVVAAIGSDSSGKPSVAAGRMGGASPPPPPPSVGAGGAGELGLHPRMVTSSTSVGSQKWDYDLKLIGGGGSDHHGLREYGTALKGRNTQEKLTMGGYVNPDVTDIRPIANGTIVWCWMSNVGPNPYLLFTAWNEPIC